MSCKMFTTRAFYDEEAGLWVAHDSEVPGLVCESDTLEGLLGKVKSVGPTLLHHNRHHLGDADPEGATFRLVTKDGASLS